jgi:hypothetical protein
MEGTARCAVRHPRPMTACTLDVHREKCPKRKQPLPPQRGFQMVDSRDKGTRGQNSGSTQLVACWWGHPHSQPTDSSLLARGGGHDFPRTCTKRHGTGVHGEVTDPLRMAKTRFLVTGGNTRKA